MADRPEKPTDDGGTVAPLPDEERRKLFDLPPAATPATTPPPPRPAGQDASFLELDYERANTTASNRAPGKVVQTIRVRGIAALVRIAVFTAAVTTLTLWVIRFVYRY